MISIFNLLYSSFERTKVFIASIKKKKTIILIIKNKSIFQSRQILINKKKYIRINQSEKQQQQQKNYLK